jgi:uncharacterized membrane protein YcaP (DUF421 family)
MQGAEFTLLTAVVVRTTIVLVAVVVGVRISGKRHIGELNVYDLMLVLVVGNAVQNAMTKTNSQLRVALVSAGTLMLLGWLAAKVTARWPEMELRVLATPTVVVQNGQLIRHNVRHEGITRDEVLAAVREQGLADLADVKLAVLEMDGSISVVTNEDARED